MKAFISYSHKDEDNLKLLHRHLAQLKRDNLIDAWTDEKILAGDNLNNEISSSLNNAQLFIALLSPDYISSSYCYEEEFKTAQAMQGLGKLTIVPVVLEPCDWKNTPFSQYKALPKDGRPVSDWSNENNAMLDVIQNIRKLVSGFSEEPVSSTKKSFSLPTNYKVKKDFDSLQKMDFQDESFKKLKGILDKNIEEINGIENIKTRILANTANAFEALIVNRNKIQTESKVLISTGNSQSSAHMRFNSSEHAISCDFDNSSNQNLGYGIAWDDFELFWERQNDFHRSEKQKLTIEEMANEIWSSWLEKVGIFN